MTRLLSHEDGARSNSSPRGSPLAAVSLAPDLFEPIASSGRVAHNLRSLAEHRVVDLPSTRWDGLQDLSSLSSVQRRALDIECRLRQADLKLVLYKTRASLIDQAYTFRKEVRSKNAGYHRAKRAYTKARDEGKVVRLQAQLYRTSRDRMLRCCSSAMLAKDLSTIYQELLDSDIRCDTSTYDPTGTDKFQLPWFWKLDRKVGEDDDTHITKGKPSSN